MYVTIVASSMNQVSPSCPTYDAVEVTDCGTRPPHSWSARQRLPLRERGFHLHIEAQTGLMGAVRPLRVGNGMADFTDASFIVNNAREVSPLRYVLS